MNENIYTIAVLTAKEGRLDDLRSVLEALAKETRKESGAIEYFFIHDENHNPNTIVSYEKWENVNEEGKHWETPHLTNAIEQLKDILDGEPVIHKGPKII
jgi:quinol monooxygenase YgiN